MNFEFAHEFAHLSVHHCGLEGWDRLNTNWRSIDASMDLWPNTN